MGIDDSRAGWRANPPAAEWRVEGVVISADHLVGRLGFASAKVRLDPDSTPPGVGVYAGWLKTAHQILPATILVAADTTSGQSDLHLEFQVLGRTDLSLHGSTVSITFVATLRDMLPLRNHLDRRSPCN